MPKKTTFHKFYATFRKLAPRFISNWMRRVGTALITPIRFSIYSGHFKSSLKEKAVDLLNRPVPWYTYPTIYFLKGKDFRDKTVLEFGAGQSTLWWADKAKSVVSFEGDLDWFNLIKKEMPENVNLFKVDQEKPNTCLSEITEILSTFPNEQKYDIIVVDGLFRTELINFAKDYLTESGIIIADNSIGYSFFEVFKDSEWQRIDFYGFAPGVSLRDCTSLFFKDRPFVLSPSTPIFDFEKINE